MKIYHRSTIVFPLLVCIVITVPPILGRIDRQCILRYIYFMYTILWYVRTRISSLFFPPSTRNTHAHARKHNCVCVRGVVTTTHTFIYGAWLWPCAPMCAHMCVCVRDVSALKKPTGCMFQCATKHVQLCARVRACTKCAYDGNCRNWELLGCYLHLRARQTTAFSGSNDICTFNRL